MEADKRRLAGDTEPSSRSSSSAIIVAVLPGRNLPVNGSLSPWLNSEAKSSWVQNFLELKIPPDSDDSQADVGGLYRKYGILPRLLT
jgi:hypothetical protein